MFQLTKNLILWIAMIWLLTDKIHFAEALRCRVCDGYDRVAYQCSSPEDKGRSRECPGPNAACELITERYTYLSNLRGRVYESRKCGFRDETLTNAGGCDPQETIGSTLVTRCVCNARDDCNSWSINPGYSASQRGREHVHYLADDFLRPPSLNPEFWQFLNKSNSINVLQNGSSSGLKCWVCDGYDRVENQCNSESRGKSVECPGPNAVCEYVKEKYVNPRHSLNGKEYTHLRCGTAVLDKKTRKCDQLVTGSMTETKRCYCNEWDDCNFSPVLSRSGRDGNYDVGYGFEIRKNEFDQFCLNFVSNFKDLVVQYLLPKSCTKLVATQLKTVSNTRQFRKAVVVVGVGCLHNLVAEKFASLGGLTELHV